MIFSNMTLSGYFNPLNAKLNLICHLLPLLRAHLIVHVSRIRVKYSVDKTGLLIIMWAGYRSRNSDWLRAGQSGDGIPVGAIFSAPVQTGPGAQPAPCTLDTESFQGEKSGRSVTLTPHPLLVLLVMKEYSYTSTSPMGRTACTEPQ
jgi:hypothetical protein